MINENLYHKTISILVKAYLNDTLEHGNYCGCAVGNLIAENMGFKITKGLHDNINKVVWDGSLELGEHWYDHLITTGIVHDTETAVKHILSTGYNYTELRKIERAFENCDYNPSEEIYMYNGLMSVVEALGEIHEVSKETTEETKLMFVRP